MKIATLPWIHVLTDMSTRTSDISVLIDFDCIISHPLEELAATPTYRFSQKAKEAPQVIFDEGQRGPSFTAIISDQFVLCNPQLGFRRIYPSGIVEAVYCVNTQRICVRNLTLLDPSDCSDAIPSNVSRACFQDNYEKNSEIFGQVVMASDGTYWYLFAFFDRALPNVPDKPQNRTMFKLFEKHHLLRFAPRFNRSHEI
ncbi:conserved hypothetical protein [Trichinella spiralis]|uniref:hypothetical protein n=1 Tax=Trichinella spiralis TaxID=6334 RepID=UPI0001EFE39F|nr:conserved hypothetical protein [Trichinella spiralis]